MPGTCFNRSIQDFKVKVIISKHNCITPWQSKDKKSIKINMPGPGFEPGLLRPQRSVLTTRRSRLAISPKVDCRLKT